MTEPELVDDQDDAATTAPPTRAEPNPHGPVTTANVAPVLLPPTIA